MADATTFLSIPEAAARLGVSRIAVFKRVKKGRLAAIRIGRNWAIPASALQTAAQTTPPSATQPPAQAADGQQEPVPRHVRPAKSRPATVRSPKPAPPPRPAEKKPLKADKNTLEEMGWD